MPPVLCLRAGGDRSWALCSLADLSMDAFLADHVGQSWARQGGTWREGHSFLGTTRRVAFPAQAPLPGRVCLEADGAQGF